MAGEFILVVDDDARGARVVGEYLRAAGYAIEYATDGEEALEKVRDLAPDLVVLDVFMPALSGLEVCEALKGDPGTRRIPILAMSAYHEFQRGEARRDLAADDFIRKPVAMDQLLRKVELLLERSAAR